MTSGGDPRLLHQYLIHPSPGSCQPSPAGLARHRPRCAEPAPGPRRGFGRTSSALAPFPGRSASRPGAAPTMRGCPLLVVLCALPWLLRAATPQRPAQPLARRRDPGDPARGADFDRVYSGVVSLSTENIYSFNYTSQPGQVRRSLPSLDSQELARSQSPRRCFGSLGNRSRETSESRGSSFPFSFRANHCLA